MQQRVVELEEAEVRALERLAEAEHRTVDDLIKRAISNYVAAQERDWSDWGHRLDDLAARMQARLPAGVTAEEIEADITAARAEVRAERAARRGAPATDADRRR